MSKEIRMTEAELTALVDSRIAADRLERAVEREPAAQPVAVTPRPPEPDKTMADALAGEFGKTLDLAKGDVTEATQRILARVQTYPRNSGDLIERPVDPEFFALFTSWYWVKESMPLYWPSFIKNVLSNIQRNREREKVA